MKILISGAGIAGLTAAWWLYKQGHEIKVIEVAKDLRAEGYMMDFFGPGYDVAEKMGVLDALKKKHHKISRFCFVNKKGQVKSSFSYDRLINMVDKRYILTMRGDLVNILHDHIKSDVHIAYATSLEKIQQEPDEVLVTYNDGNAEKFDLVIGADGIHSKVRELIFGPEEQFRRYMGFYVASFILNKNLPLPQGHNQFYAISKPNKQAVIYPVTQNKFAPFFAWRSKAYPNLKPEEQQGVIKGLFQNIGWLIPKVISEIGDDIKLYFDTASQIHMDRWFNGRVVLIGDACACMSLLAGQGSSFAMAGAYLLADSFSKSNKKLPDTLQMYQNRLKPIISSKQENARKFSKSFVPDSHFTMMLRNLFVKVMFNPLLRRITKKQLGGENNDLIY